MASKTKPCKYGKKCYRKNPDHLRNFAHPDPSDDEEESSVRTKAKTITAISDEPEPKRDKPGLNKRLSSPDEEGGVKRRKTEEDLPASPQGNDSPTGDEDVGRVGEVEEEHLPEPKSPEDVKESIKMKFLVDMPEDFYKFWDLCVSMNPSHPQDALKCIRLRLVGPFDVMSGKHRKVTRNKHGRRPNFLLHHRYYYDPPEFQTVLLSQDNDKLHFGYFRDDPSQPPVFVASNSPGAATSKEKITPCGDNLFAAVHIHANKVFKTASPFDKPSIQRLVKSLNVSAPKHGLDLSASTPAMKQRQKKVVCPSFHGAGVVVPVDDNDIGYRPVPETPGDLKAMLKKISQAQTEADRDRHMEGLQELITLIQFANDECDYGEGLELGLDLFSFGGKVFHPQISILLPLAYQLLGRGPFGDIITAHLARRAGVDGCVDELAV